MSGTGKFKTKACNRGNKDREGIMIRYTVSGGTHIHEAADVLVACDGGVVMEVFAPVPID